MPTIRGEVIVRFPLTMLVGELLFSICLWLWQSMFPTSPNCRSCGYKLEEETDFATCPKCNATEPHKSGIALVGFFVFGAVLLFVLVLVFG